jgi:glycosyltransferase involved in cell wall biosynthesis
MSVLQRAHHGRAVFFPNYFTPPIPSKARTVTVINDLQYLHYPQHFSGIKRAWLRVAHEITLRRADATVAISEYVKRDIVSRYRVRESERIHVIPWPIRWSAFNRPAEPEPLVLEWLEDAKVVLTVAAQYPHKNLHTLVRAFARVWNDRRDVRLVLVGQVPSNLIGTVKAEPLEAIVQSTGSAGAVHVTGYVDDAELGWWYSRADIFVFPSLFEGMGRPAVEALGMGLPVLTTRCTAVPEMTRGLAVYLDRPSDDVEMASRLHEILDNPRAHAPTQADVESIRRDFSTFELGRRFADLLLR